MPNNDFQNGLIMASIAGGAKDGYIVQSDWNTNDAQSPSYVKNRPFYTDKVESDVWEFELPIMNEATGEGIYPAIPIPDADFSQFTDKQELNYYITSKVVSGDEHIDEGILYFIKDLDIRSEFEEASVEFDSDVPEKLPCLCQNSDSAYYPKIIFGVKFELIGDPSSEDAKVIIHNDPNSCTVTSPDFDGNSNYTVQVHIENFKNIVEQVHQLPDKYINWDGYVNTKKWKWEYHIPAMPFSTQPTIVTGNVSKLKADTFYFIKYTDAAETKFKLTYGEDVFVDDTLEFNLNNAWSSRDHYEFIHCISVDTANNTAVFGKPYLDDSLLPCIVPNNTKSLRIQTSARAVNMDIKNSPFPQYNGSGAWGVGILVLADGQFINGNNYETYGCYTGPTFDSSNNSVTMKEMIVSGEAVGLILNFTSIPVCIIDPKSDDELAKITNPRYEGLLQYDANISVADDRRSYNMEGILTGVCWNSIELVTFTTPFNVAEIKASYPTQCYSQLKSEDKKLFFKTNEANDKQTQLIVSISSQQVLTGFSITIEGEVE